MLDGIAIARLAIDAHGIQSAQFGLIFKLLIVIVSDFGAGTGCLV